MAALLLKILRAVMRKAVLVVLVALVSVAVLGTYLYLHHHLDSLERNRTLLLQEKSNLSAQIERLTREVERKKQETQRLYRQMQDLDRDLERLRSFWRAVNRRIFGPSDEERRLEEDRQALATLHRAARQDLAATGAELDTQLTTLDRLEGDLRAITEELRPWEYARRQVRLFGRQAWEKLRWHILITSLLILFGPTLWALFLYYLWAPWIRLTAPVLIRPQPPSEDSHRLARPIEPDAVPPLPPSRQAADPARDPSSLPGSASSSAPSTDTAGDAVPPAGWAFAASRDQDSAADAPELAAAAPEGGLRILGSGVSLCLSLEPGQACMVRESFLQAKDEILRKRTRFVFNWRYPFTCVSAGLIELIALRLPEEATVPAAVTFSTGEEETTEVIGLELSPEQSIILRPRHLAGVVYQGEIPPSLRTHWRLLAWHSWVTLQFRYFEMGGPGCLILWGRRGIRYEPVHPGPGRRTNASATVGFSPNLAYQSVRAETFWSYYRGMNPLFDDLFLGRGFFLCQEISDSSSPSPGRFWSRLWDGILKVFGV